MGPQVSGRVPTPEVSKEAEERARQGPGYPVMFFASLGRKTPF